MEERCEKGKCAKVRGADAVQSNGGNAGEGGEVPEREDVAVWLDAVEVFGPFTPQLRKRLLQED